MGSKKEEVKRVMGKEKFRVSQFAVLLSFLRRTLKF